MQGENYSPVRAVYFVSYFFISDGEIEVVNASLEITSGSTFAVSTLGII